MTTFANMIDRIQVFLNDEGDATWDTEIVGSFLNDAIRDYSQYFPKVSTTTINCADDDHQYDLPSDFMGILSVEYPDGEDPPEYLIRKRSTAAGWWDADDLYDIIYNRDANNVDEIIISAAPATGEDIVIYYNAYHGLMSDPSSPSGTLTVPEPHQQLLVKFCRWQAALHLASAEQQTPTSNSSLLMAQLAQNARRDEVAYNTALQQALYIAEGVSQHAQWTENKSTGVERIY